MEAAVIFVELSTGRPRHARTKRPANKSDQEPQVLQVLEAI